VLVNDGLQVEFTPSAQSMIVTHSDGKLTIFKLIDGLYRTTLSRMHRPALFFSDDEDIRGGSVSIMTRSMTSRSNETVSRSNTMSRSVPVRLPLSNNVEEPAVSSRNTLENVRENLTDIERQRAIQVRELHNALGHPSDSAMIKLLQGGKLRGCPLGTRDVEEANKLLGPCLACRMANMPEAPAPASLREPPRLDGEQFNADIMFVKDSGWTKSPYLVLVDERNGMIIGRHLANRSVKVLHPAMETIINFIEALMRRRPRRIFVDRESVLKDFESFASVQVVRSAANRHARVAERAIRTVKDRMRATLTSLPYKLPGQLYKHLADWSIQRINMIPNSKSFPRTPGEIYVSLPCLSTKFLRLSLVLLYI